MNTRKLIYSLFLISYLLFVGSSTYVLKEAYPWLYFGKHIAIICLAFFSLIVIPNFLNSAQMGGVLAITILIIPYFFSGFDGMLVAAQYLILFLAALAVSSIWNGEVTKKTILIFFLIAATPAFCDLYLNGGDFIYNDYYGRGRLLMGYFHPKEAALGWMIPIMMLHFCIGKKTPFLYAIFLLFFYFIQSRNALLFYFSFLFILYLHDIFRTKKAIIIYISIIIFITLYSFTIENEKLDNLLSNRLTLWSGSEISLIGFGTLIPDFNITGEMTKFHIDNFYLEYLVENGIISFFLLVFILIFFGYRLGLIKINGVYINAIYIPFLVFCFFDSGMFSTGNFFNLFVWSLVNFGLSRHYQEKLAIR